MGNIAPLAAKHLRIAMMNASNHGIMWAGDASVHRGTIVGARNAVVDSVLEKNDDGTYKRDVDGVFWCDDDITLDPEAISALVAINEDFVSGIYCQRAGNYWPLIARFDEESQKFQWCIKFPADTLAPMDGCGFGVVYTSSKLLRTLGPEPFNNLENMSEDLSFCLRAKRAGFQLYTYTSILCGHLSDPTPITYDTFTEEWEKKSEEERNDLVRGQ
jgi:GT2 family glycosyltransferase